MTKICGDAENFATSALRGFADIHRDIVRLVRGGVIRSRPATRGKVSLVVGGGSGHFPAFNGYVGKGFADASVAGDVFASPSTQAILRIAREAHLGGGVILGYGNYAGDVLNFSIAAERLRAEGIDTRMIATTDDIASAPEDEAPRRRGTAGDLPVFKIIGAAAEEGMTLDQVEAIGKHANARTRTFGVAFDGCTLPGEKEKLFHVPDGRMAIGLGVHGEPGIDETDVLSAEALASLLCDRLLREAPAGGGSRITAVLNGLGATKYEELFVLWEAIIPHLENAGYTVIAPLAGEYITSLDMAGCSLTIVWLDEELERLWRAPVESAAFRRDLVSGSFTGGTPSPADIPSAYMKSLTEAGRQGGRCVATVMHKLSLALSAAEHELGQIDALAGDGDHGQGMARGAGAAARAALAAVDAGAGPASVLAAAADAWADRAGGTSGALWGAGLFAFSTAFDDAAAPDAQSIATGLRRAMEKIMALGKARPGDKTLMDALHPLVETFEDNLRKGEPIARSWQDAAIVSMEAAEATKDLLPRLGRARTHGERSKGHPDAGAISLALCARVVGEELAALSLR
ncbi:dihydroxyacetone kinase family protein [Swaminathania salitolerans]|uniref:Erythrulose kinase n=1 Tax=Swaminathania salitolerans TaxID=182838 RepID=A0A511BNL9_9PROT|nr:dihydroxyacetone kinase family protein [Swaminathania salitolerans]GBQ14936.1 dihydroxyacetone kinase [Swaminathania salitolerans LMG 21291]GEL01937.1 erythrulose kinase [Swaminathania salitolerans]